jgi:hypothetical protein
MKLENGFQRLEDHINGLLSILGIVAFGTSTDIHLVD